MTEVGTEGAQPDGTAPNTGRGRRRTALAMVVVASLLLLPAILSIWANRQVLNTDNWTRTSTQLLQNRLIRDQLATYLVDQVYANVDVQAEIARALPPRLDPLAGPAAGGLRELAERAAKQALARPRAQERWAQANRQAQLALLKVLEGGGPNVSTEGGNVTLNLRNLVALLTATRRDRLAIAAGAARERGRGDGAALESAQARPGRVEDHPRPPVRADHPLLRALRRRALRRPRLAPQGPARVRHRLRPRRRGRAARALHRRGSDRLGAGHHGVGPAGHRRRVGHRHAACSRRRRRRPSCTASSWWPAPGSRARRGGPSRSARRARRTCASRRSHTAVLAVVVVLVLWWGPTPATRNPSLALVLIALMAIGTEVLRRQIVREYPEARRGDTLQRMRPPSAPAHARAWSWARTGAAGGQAALASTTARVTAYAGGGGGGGADHPARPARAAGAAAGRGVLDEKEFRAQKREILAEDVPPDGPETPHADGEGAAGPDVGGRNEKEARRAPRARRASPSAGRIRGACRRRRRAP